MATPPDAALQRLGQIKGAGDDRALFLKLGAAEVLDAFERTTVFKGKTRERNIKGGKSVAFPITGKMSARYHSPGVPILGEGNNPSDLNERVIELDALMIADAAVAEIDELMNYYDVRQIYTTELGRALAYEYDRRVARILFAAASNVTEPLAKSNNSGRIGAGKTLTAGYAAATNQAKGDELVDAIFAARVNFETKDVPTDGLYAVFPPEEYFHISQSSRAINADFNGGGGSNGSIATGRTLQVAGIPIYMSNHVTQAAYTNVTGDKNTDYQQDLSKCRGLIFNKEAAGVVTLMSPSLQVTSGDWNVQMQATLMVARQALGMGVLRSEAAYKIVLP
jgi:hypothetical protein